jgi:hypothetical protein
MIEVSQQEVKMATVGSKKATKPQMIAWAHAACPGAAWAPFLNKQGQVMAKAEHLADAAATVVAGIKFSPAWEVAANAFQPRMAFIPKKKPRVRVT